MSFYLDRDLIVVGLKLIFKRNIFNKMNGPERNDDGSWIILINYELDQAIQGTNVVGFLKSLRLDWLGHVKRTDDCKRFMSVLGWKRMRIRENQRKNAEERRRGSFEEHGNAPLEKFM